MLNQSNQNKKTKQIQLHSKKPMPKKNTMKSSLIAVTAVVGILLLCSQMAAIPTVAAAGTETVSINVNSTVATNYLSLGFQLDGRDIASFASSFTLQNLAEQANFKMVRFFHHRYGWAVTNWNSQTMSGSWNWNNYDRVVNAITAAGAQPLICLGYGGSGEMSLPSGMPRWSEDSYFPDPTQFAAYARQWVQHFQGKVKYYEILNEPIQHYFWSDSAKLARYTRFFNIVSAEMKKADPTIFISQDSSAVKSVLDYWVNNGNHLDFLGFHKYDSSSTRPATDAELFARAESEDIGDIPTTTRKYTLAEARSLYGANTPIICGESNINWMFYPTDTRIQTMTAAVWAGLSIRFWSVQGLNYWLWWDFAGRGSSQTKFGMVNLDNNQPWYPYYVMKMFASNSAVGDTIVQSTANSEDIRSLAWYNGGNLNILIIHKGTDSTNIGLNGVTGTFTYQKLDTQHCPPQIGTVNSANTITIDGYTVMLLQQKTESTQTPQPTPTPQPNENEQPVASMSAPTQSSVDLRVSFYATSSYDPDGYIIYYSWNFGDNTEDSGGRVTHTYTSAGTYTITLTVTDNLGMTSSTTQRITIQETQSHYWSTHTYRTRSYRRR
jgi:PKD repeat protein